MGDCYLIGRIARSTGNQRIDRVGFLGHPEEGSRCDTTRQQYANDARSCKPLDSHLRRLPGHVERRQRLQGITCRVSWLLKWSAENRIQRVLSERAETPASCPLETPRSK